MSVELTDLRIRFGSLVALDGASLQLRDGEVHALLGANGSGKSTMVKVLTGVYTPDSGRIAIDGTVVTAGWSPAAATSAGVRVVHQEAPLLDSMSIAESVALFTGYPRRRGGSIAWRQLRATTAEVLERCRIARRPSDLTGALSGAERATLAVELATRSGGDGLRLLVLDEATAALPEGEAALFLEHVRRIADAGVPVLMVTHRLAELTWADQVTVLSDGAVALSGPSDQVGVPEAVEIMRSGGIAHAGGAETRTSGTLGRLWQGEAGRGSGSGAVVLRAEGVTGERGGSLTLELRAGEIVGAIGPRGGGVEALPRLLSGAAAATGGRLAVRGRELPLPLRPRQAIAAGILHLPADRLHEGGLPSLPVSENITLPDARRFWHRRGRERDAVRGVIDYLDVRPRDPHAVFGRLSGGNQQKAILGRLLRMQPTVLILADPTYGVDPAAREIMFDAIREARDTGIAVLVTSTEPEQLSGLCDRVLLIEDGVVAEELTDSDLTVESLLARAV
jgi:ribose transport system ATP-binding protein